MGHWEMVLGSYQDDGCSCMRLCLSKGLYYLGPDRRAENWIRMGVLPLDKLL